MTTTEEYANVLPVGDAWSLCLTCGEVIYRDSRFVAGWRHTRGALHGAAPDHAAEFFYMHAGWSYRPEEETAEQGRRRTARELAEAERAAHQHGWVCTWGDDWTVGSHVKEYGTAAYETEPETCEVACLVDGADQVLASLGCVDDASDEYRRVIAAELAAEALAEIAAGEETSNMANEQASDARYPWNGGGSWTPEAFELAFTRGHEAGGEPYEIPSDIRRAAERIVSAFGSSIRGMCDPMYVANVIARETNRGDGESTFYPVADERHQDFTNYETFAVAVTVDNDQPRIVALRRQIRLWLRESGAVDVDYVEEVPGAAYVAGKVRDLWDQHAPELNDEYSSLLSAALGEVNWYELAAHWIADMEEEGK